MAKSSGQKLKLLYLIKMLRENTDENHPMSTPDIIKYLENQGIHAERKSIYNDMECLADFGYDVVQVQSRLGGGYYLGSREFELPELKLLVDAVQSSRFITTKKSRELIRKLEQIAGKTMPVNCSDRSMWPEESRRRMRAFITALMRSTGLFRKISRSLLSTWTGILKSSWCPDQTATNASVPGP